MDPARAGRPGIAWAHGRRRVSRKTEGRGPSASRQTFRHGRTGLLAEAVARVCQFDGSRSHDPARIPNRSNFIFNRIEGERCVGAAKKKSRLFGRK